MSKDAIYREDAIKTLTENVMFEFTEDEEWAITCLQNLPSADRPQGEWVEDPINESIMQCSNCKTSYTKDFLKSMTLYAEPKEVPNYCPICGADTRGEDDE